MAVRRILLYGAASLRQEARPVANLDGAIQRLIDDMVETMYAAPGVGLAANQVGQLTRVIVANPSEGHDPRGLLAIVNPEIVAAEGEMVWEEGCLSIPEFRGEVVRSRRVLVRGIDRDEKPLEVEATDLLARILQHEVDHLNGVLFIDRLSTAKRDLLKRKLKKAFLEKK